MYKCRHCGNYDRKEQECCIYGDRNPNDEACINYWLRPGLGSTILAAYLQPQDDDFWDDIEEAEEEEQNESADEN